LNKRWISSDNYRTLSNVLYS